MDPRRRSEVEAAFDEALDLGPEERASFLREMNARDPSLGGEVRALLDAHDREEGILDRPRPPLTAAVDAAGPSPTARVADVLAGRDPTRIGPYRVLRELGRGGMGVVYLAERDDGQFRQRVAVKAIRGGLADPGIHGRFLAERQILASLDHPGIARLLDGGVTADGMPYLVMEHVEGLPITAYCDRHRLGLDERIRLFRAACSAVHHAHQNLVIHRDLKPGHVLVTDSGEVKLLDFGIAKLLNPSLGPADAPLTLTEHRVLTPEYASPEQVRGEPLTTTSDVYALGVILYELLTGHRPYRLARRSPQEILELVCERDPERPSTRVVRTELLTREDGSSREVTPEAVAAARGASAERLRRRLRGDLDDIVMMALRKEPRRRYASAQLLGEDLGRYLAGLPVMAHRDSRSYRLRKFVRRHRMESAAAGLIAISLLAGVGLASREARVARWERDRAADALIRAEEALAQSEAVTSFLIGLFEASGPGEAPGDTVTARELLLRGAARAEELAGQPAVQARMLEAMGRVHAGLGEYARGQEFLERALAVRRAHYGPRHPEVAESLVHLGTVLRQRARYPEAERAQEEALAIRIETLGEGHPAVAESLAELGSMAIYGANLPRADSLYRRSLGLRRATLGNDHPVVADALIFLGATIRRQGRAEEAEALFREALDLRVRLFGTDHPLVAVAAVYLADLIVDFKGESEEPERLYRDALASLERAHGPSDTRLIHALNSLGSLAELTGQPSEAERLYRRAAAIQTQVLGPDHPTVGAARAGVAAFLRRQGRHAEAERLAREALEIQWSALGPDHPAVAATLGTLAEIRLAVGDLQDAEAIARESIAVNRRVLPAQHFNLAMSLTRLGAVLVRQGRYAEAEILLEEARAAVASQYAPDYPDLRPLYEALAELHAATGRADEAARYRTLAARVAGS